MNLLNRTLWIGLLLLVRAPLIAAEPSARAANTVVLDATGRHIAQQEFAVGRHTWSYAGLPAGAYIVRCAGASGNTVQKVVVE